jgi:hypothetical protein
LFAAGGRAVWDDAVQRGGQRRGSRDGGHLGHAKRAAEVHDQTPGPQFSAAQLAFAALSSLVLYGMFVVTLTMRHRDFFLPVI